MAVILPDMTWIYAWIGASILLVALHFYRNWAQKKGALKFANVPVLEQIESGSGGRHGMVSLGIKILAILLICLAGGGLALEQTVPAKTQHVVVAVDTSFSMAQRDYKPNRLDAAKKAIKTFISGIDEKTKVAVVSFGPRTELVQNFTGDKEALRQSVNGLEITGRVGTAIGGALFVSAKTIPRGGKGSIILMTDGANNLGVTVESALSTVKRRGIPVHTVGLGSTNAEFSDINPETLKLIAAETGGISSIGTTGEELNQIYERIGNVALERKVKKKRFSLTPFLLIGALALLLLEAVLESTLFQVVT